MVADPDAIRGIESAVDADPENTALRLHLASMLIDAGRPREGLEHSRAVLENEPDDPDALKVALLAAQEAQDADAAADFRELLEQSGTKPAESERLLASGAHDLTSKAPDEDLPDTDQAERPTVTLDDVGGMEEVKRRLNASFLGPMRNPELREAFRKSLRGGLMLYGPPGCGKTFIARAVAGELGARFTAVGIADVLDMYLGESERKLHELFQMARRNAPCVLFLDEVDALGQKRSHLRGSAGRAAVNQLLTELDAVDTGNEGVFVLAATNHPWDVDTALRRPGRFDRMLLVLPPDEPARKAILDLHLRERPVSDTVDTARIARTTDTFSGADLAYLCELAAEAALEDSIESGELREIGNRDLAAALRQIEPSTRAWFDVAYNYAMFANEGGQYDELLEYIKTRGLK